MLCQRVNWSSTQMPDWREPLPDLPLPPNGRWASAPEVELLIDTIPALIRSRKRKACVGDERPERLAAVDLVLGSHAGHERRVVEDARLGVADEALARGVGRDPPD